MCNSNQGDQLPVPGLTVVRAGVQSSIQDLGRFGYARHGLSQGGAMDLHAYCWVNKLLKNSANCPALEIVIGMAELRAECDLSLALAGADMQPSVDGESIQNWSSFEMKCGQVLTLKAAVAGMRSYLGVAGGGFQMDDLLGSVSAVVRNGMGRFFEAGDCLQTIPHEKTMPGSVPYRYRSQYDESIELRVIESYQAEQFSFAAKELFYSTAYTLTSDADRMGARLDGRAIPDVPGRLISEGIALGSIQIPADGQPIILLNDRQTLGGYPKMGCVARVDLPILAQARPGTKIRFCPVSLEQARMEWLDFCRFFGMG